MPTTTPVTDDRLIVFRGGFTARTSTVLWLLDRSWHLTFQVEDGHLLVRPQSAITDDDDEFIRAHRDELIAAVAYVEEQCERPV